MGMLLARYTEVSNQNQVSDLQQIGDVLFNILLNLLFLKFNYSDTGVIIPNEIYYFIGVNIR